MPAPSLMVFPSFKLKGSKSRLGLYAIVYFRSFISCQKDQSYLEHRRHLWISLRDPFSFSRPSSDAQELCHTLCLQMMASNLMWFWCVFSRSKTLVDKWLVFKALFTRVLYITSCKLSSEKMFNLVYPFTFHVVEALQSTESHKRLCSTHIAFNQPWEIF